MSYPIYEVPAGDVLPILFSTYAGSTGASITLTGLAVTDIEIYKDGSVTQRSSDAGYTLLDTDGIDFDGVTGIHGFSIDTGDNTDSGFYTVGAWFHVVVSAVTVDSQTVNFIAAAFRLMPAESVAGKPKVDTDTFSGTAATASGGRPEVNVTHLLGTAWLTPGTAGTPDVNVKLISDDATAADNAELMFDGTGYAGGTARLKVDVDTIKTNPVVNGGTITFPSGATLASTTNITAGTVTTATNVTTVNGLAAGVITAASIASNAITTAKINDGAFTAAKFGSAFIDTTSFASGVGDYLGDYAALSVWEFDQGSWTPVNPSFGKLVMDNLNATVSSRSSHSASDVWAVGTRLLTAGTNIVLPSNGLSAITTWTVALTGNITGNLSGSVNSVTTAVTITGDAATAGTRFLTMITADGSNWKFTEDALQEAPTGGGGGSAPTVGEIDAQLSATHGAGAWGASGSGGAFAFTITVTDGTDPLQNVAWSVYDGVTLVAFGVTDASGNGSGTAGSGTYGVNLVKAGYAFTPTTRTVTGNQTGTIVSADLEMDLVTVPSAPTDATMCRLYGYLELLDGTVAANKTFEVRLVTVAGIKSNKVVVGRAITIGTDSAGMISSEVDGVDVPYFELQRNDLMTPNTSTYTVHFADAGLNGTSMTLSTATRDIASLIS